VVKGAGIIAAGPYGCAEGSVNRAQRECMAARDASAVPPLQRTIAYTEAAARSGGIDAPAHLAKARVWLFSGREDRTVLRPVVDALRDYYRHYLESEKQLVYVTSVGAGHAMVTAGYGKQCDYTGRPFIDDCSFDAAGELLSHLYGPLQPPSANPQGRTIEFDQNEFAGGNAYFQSLADRGFAYVPDVCSSTVCRVHVAFHGCQQSASEIGDAFHRHAGYNRWADTNRLIVLYPQTIRRYGWAWSFTTWNFVYNPKGCWDWWGYTTRDYDRKTGPQIRAVKRMLDRLTSPR